MFVSWLLSMLLCCCLVVVLVIVAIVLLLLRFLSLLLYLAVLLTRAGPVSGSMLPSQEISTIDKKERWREGEGGEGEGGRGRGMTCPARQRFR